MIGKKFIRSIIGRPLVPIPPCVGLEGGYRSDPSMRGAELVAPDMVYRSIILLSLGSCAVALAPGPGGNSGSGRNFTPSANLISSAGLETCLVVSMDMVEGNGLGTNGSACWNVLV